MRMSAMRRRPGPRCSIFSRAPTKAPRIWATGIALTWNGRLLASPSLLDGQRDPRLADQHRPIRVRRIHVAKNHPHLNLWRHGETGQRRILAGISGWIRHVNANLVDRTGQAWDLPHRRGDAVGVESVHEDRHGQIDRKST